ncbi:sirohydrochlorin chelatase [Candidatus Hodgkinia cicadicola]
MYIFFIGHGSSKLAAISEFLYIVDLFKIFHPRIKVGCWLLEFGKVQLTDSFKPLSGISLIIPIMLLNSKHIKYDICVICNYLQLKFKVDIILIIGICSNILNTKLVCNLIKQKLLSYQNKININTNMLVLVYRGGSDISANALSHLIGRLIWEGTGFVWCEIAFIGITFPLIKFTSNVRSMSSKFIVPFLLFYGELYCNLSDNCKGDILTNYIFNDITSVLAFYRRIRISLNDLGFSGCNFCKYRLLYSL